MKLKKHNFGPPPKAWLLSNSGYDFIPTVLDREIVDYWVPWALLLSWIVAMVTRRYKPMAYSTVHIPIWWFSTLALVEMHSPLPRILEIGRVHLLLETQQFHLSPWSSVLDKFDMCFFFDIPNLFGIYNFMSIRKNTPGIFPAEIWEISGEDRWRWSLRHVPGLGSFLVDKVGIIFGFSQPFGTVFHA